MARTINQEHRESLVDAVATRFIEAGTARASLRDLAQDVGTSARMLMHHFGSRERLVDAALEVARARQLAAAREAVAPGPDAILVLESVWRWFRSEETRRYFALFTEVAARERTLPDGERRFTQRLGSDWRPLFERVFEADARYASDAPELALIVIGVLRGFALDIDEGDGLADHEQAFATLVALIAARGTR